MKGLPFLSKMVLDLEAEPPPGELRRLKQSKARCEIERIFCNCD